MDLADVHFLRTGSAGSRKTVQVAKHLSRTLMRPICSRKLLVPLPGAVTGAMPFRPQRAYSTGGDYHQQQGEGFSGPTGYGPERDGPAYQQREVRKVRLGLEVGYRSKHGRVTEQSKIGQVLTTTCMTWFVRCEKRTRITKGHHP